MRCARDDCDALVKPDIVFFGENLPERFGEKASEDFPKCDLLIVAGTSLAVHPFAGLVGEVDEGTPRLLVNREKVGEWFSLPNGFRFDRDDGSSSSLTSSKSPGPALIRRSASSSLRRRSRSRSASRSLSRSLRRR